MIDARVAEAIRQAAILQARDSFYAFRQHISTKPGKGVTLKRGWWVKHSSNALQSFYDDFIEGKRPKLVIAAPPQHGKSRLVTEFVAWISGKHPELMSIYTSFSDRLGVKANLMLRRIYQSPKFIDVFPDFRFGETGQQNTTLLEHGGHGGYFRNTTVMGSITGESLDLGIIDDPIKGRDQAQSAVFRDKVWDWFTDDFFTRFDENAAMLSILTRWHIDDPIGRLLERDKSVKYLRYPAFAESDSEFRKTGEPLFPEHKSAEFLKERKTVMRAANWQALYQQNPILPEGDMIKLEWFGRYGQPQADYDMVVHSWDTASKANELADPSVGIVWGVKGKRYEVIEVVRGKWEYPDLKRKIESIASKYLPDAVLIEDKASGQALIQDLKRSSKLAVIPMLPTADKVTRMAAESAAIEAGQVILPSNAPWLSDYESEMQAFPNAPHDDQVDATSQFLKWIKARQTTVMPRIRRL